jgi:peptidoglycan-associated lipoprotein
MIVQRLVRAAMAGAVFAFVLAGCSSVDLEEQKPAPIVDASQAGKSTTGPDPRAVAPVDAQSSRGLDPFNDPASPLYNKSVYFDFDSFVVKSEYQPVVEAHGKYLASTKNRRIVVEGHTDERGGREYNLALGQKRAEAVKQRLMLLGATDAQIETVSFGKEKPKAVGSNEEAWAQNRRADIVYR